MNHADDIASVAQIVIDVAIVAGLVVAAILMGSWVLGAMALVCAGLAVWGLM